MKEFNLQLNVNEVNMIIKTLGNMPFNQVNDLITKIHAQAQEQLEPTNGQEKVTLNETRAN